MPWFTQIEYRDSQKAKNALARLLGGGFSGENVRLFGSSIVTAEPTRERAEKSAEDFKMISSPVDIRIRAKNEREKSGRRSRSTFGKFLKKMDEVGRKSLRISKGFTERERSGVEEVFDQITGRKEERR